MKYRTKIIIFAASVLSVALFFLLWTASAPIRIKKQFEKQANAQLRGLTFMQYVTFNKRTSQEKRVMMSYKTKFTALHIKSVVRQPSTGGYKVIYWIEWDNQTERQIIKMDTACSLTESWTHFQGQCGACEPRRPYVIKRFTINTSR